MKVLQKNQIKVLETEKLLREIITSPVEFKDDEELMEALKSQSGIAKYQDQNRTIEPCSLNTLKSNAESLLERGFLALDELRISAKERIEEAQSNTRAAKGKSKTKAELELEKKELKSELDMARRSNFFLTIIVSELLARLKQLAEHEGTVDERLELYRDHNRRIEAELSHTLDGEFLSSKLEQLPDLIEALSGEV